LLIIEARWLTFWAASRSWGRATTPRPTATTPGTPASAWKCCRSRNEEGGGLTPAQSRTGSLERRRRGAAGRGTSCSRSRRRRKARAPRRR